MTACAGVGTAQFQLRDDRRTLWDNGGHLGTGSENLDDAPYTDDLELGAVGTRADLAARLRLVHLRADSPSLRTLEVRTRHSGTPLSKTSVADMLKGTRFPRKAVMVAFLRACGVPDDKMEPWQRTWERVASREAGPTRHGETRAPASHQGQASADSTGMSQPRGQSKEPAQADEQPRSASSIKRRRAANQPRPDDLAGGREARNPITRQSTWHFPDRTQITLAA